MKGYQVIQKIEHMKECQAGVSEGSVNIKTGWRLDRYYPRRGVVTMTGNEVSRFKLWSPIPFLP